MSVERPPRMRSIDPGTAETVATGVSAAATLLPALKSVFGLFEKTERQGQPSSARAPSVPIKITLANGTVIEAPAASSPEDLRALAEAIAGAG